MPSAGRNMWGLRMLSFSSPGQSALVFPPSPSAPPGPVNRLVRDRAGYISTDAKEPCSVLSSLECVLQDSDGPIPIGGRWTSRAR